MSIPEWLKGMLKEGRYRSVYEMSHALNVPQPTVHRWLTGQTTPSAPYCWKLAEATGTPVQDVMRMAYGDGEGSGEGGSR
ncbi:MAG: XRE family transcriptional regulator [Dehalococcoidia bacterium]|nr:MAG: XRE family transcriptional regulator [Dehalococcoidia bacterium]